MIETTRRRLLQMAGLGLGTVALPVISVPAAQATGVTRVAASPYRVGRWLPSDQRVLDSWLRDLVRDVDAKPMPLHPVMQELQDLIESDATLYMQFHQMFEQLGDKKKFERTPTGAPQVRHYRHMIQLINGILGTAPTYNRTGLVGFPINAILDWPMNTPAGEVAFLNPALNAQFKKILDTWAAFLNSPASVYVLNDEPRHGWLGRDAMAAMPGFARDFECDPTAAHYGFTSWDDFFVRTFRPGRRPVAAPDDDGVIVSACESAPYRIARNLKRVDTFWLKGQPYSLRHVFADDPVNEEFVGGTLYQAFLSALSYHRWHSPVSGTIVRTTLVDGSYYAQSPAVGLDPYSPNESQSYITETAARGIILIEADDPRIGLMAFVSVGMAEVSTNEITVQPGQRVEKGDQLGMFHFGGSTHCLIFRPGVRIDFDLDGQTPSLTSRNIQVRSRLAVIQG
jgi:phosphatidylserine decarboxylase